MTSPTSPSTPATLVVDLSRLVYAALSRTPTGIPRVELAYAEHFIGSNPADLRFVVLDAVGRLRLLDNRTAMAFARDMSAYWRGNVGSTRAYLRILLRHLHIHTLLLLRPGGDLKRFVAGHGGRCIYIIPSQLQLERSALIEGLKAAGDLRIVYLVHDIIPSLYPEYFPPDAEDRNRRRMRAAARLADLIVVNSHATEASFRARFGRDLPPEAIVVAPLGVTPGPSAASPVELPAAPYFLMIGTIEPRKNHILILNLWRTLRAEYGERTPRLVIVGSRGWENENVVDMLERSPALRGFVEERSRLDDGDVAALLMGAQALLLPSFAEGYGLPLVEALQAGTPVLCSDLAAFREVGGDVPEFIDPLDGPRWRAAIVDYADPASARRAAQLARRAGWTAPRWADHFATVDAAIARLGRHR